MRRTRLPLPEHRYVPGQTARHGEDAFAQICARALPRTSTATADANIAWLYGLDLIEAGFHWEAHEVLETVWMNAPEATPERVAVQAIIQIANAALKQRMGREKAALRLCDIAQALVRDAATDDSAVVMTVSISAMDTAIDALRARIIAGKVEAVVF